MQTKSTLEAQATSVGKAERQAIKALDPDLGQHGLLTEHVYNFIGKVLGRSPTMRLDEVSRPRRIATLLLSRLRDDVRCAALLALRGYPEQACTLVASIYEAAFTIAAIGSDDALAQEWIEHDDPNRTFKAVQTLTRDALHKLGVPDPDRHSRRRYIVYRQLCLPEAPESGFSERARVQDRGSQRSCPQRTRHFRGSYQTGAVRA